MKVLKFSASWCGPCQTLTKTLQSIDIPIIHYDVDSEESEEAVTKYGIRNVPVLIFTDDEGNELKRLVGAASRQTILDIYNTLNES